MPAAPPELPARRSNTPRSTPKSGAALPDVYTLTV
jgi:hypothetical protein